MTSLSNSPQTLDQYVAPTWRDNLAYVARLFWRDKGGLIGLVIFILLVLTALFADVIAPAEKLEQNLRVASQPPAWQPAKDRSLWCQSGSQRAETPWFGYRIIAGSQGLDSRAIRGVGRRVRRTSDLRSTRSG